MLRFWWENIAGIHCDCGLCLTTMQIVAVVFCMLRFALLVVSIVGAVVLGDFVACLVCGLRGRHT